MSSGFDLLSGAPKKLWVSLLSVSISFCHFFNFCKQSWSLEKKKNQTFLIIGFRLRSKRCCSWVDCLKDCLTKRLLFSILGFRGLVFT
ncbi:hypothetical protein MANES_05G122804v8 [Manihot esculenta]|uniref:Uncharacterized protein n=1 Tax=Manihot esculenta TaxID=3983 RepID=A0ACB7HP03_MANES|nr:hypothetical protein MANES_05G122804v8 [Manihot esculenta]